MITRRLTFLVLLVPVVLGGCISHVDRVIPLCEGEEVGKHHGVTHDNFEAAVKEQSLMEARGWSNTSIQSSAGGFLSSDKHFLTGKCEAGAVISHESRQEYMNEYKEAVAEDKEMNDFAMTIMGPVGLVILAVFIATVFFSTTRRY